MRIAVVGANGRTGRLVVEQALARNPDVRTARSRLDEVRAQRAGAVLQYLPQGDATASGRRTRTEQISGTDAYHAERVTDRAVEEATRTGEAASRLEFEKGNMEVAEWQGRRWLRGTSWPSVFHVVLPEVLPERFTLHPGYPNPFQHSTTLEYDLPEPAPVTVTVYNTLGSEVARLVDGVQAAGRRQVVWDGRDRSGQRLGAGIYFARMQVGGTVWSQTLVLVK
mgnify:CR=1 FL=1